MSFNFFEIMKKPTIILKFVICNMVLYSFIKLALYATIFIKSILYIVKKRVLLHLLLVYNLPGKKSFFKGKTSLSGFKY